MYHPSNPDEICKTVKLLPVLTSDAFDHCVGRGGGEGNHHNKRRHSDRYEWSLYHITYSSGKIPATVEYEICDQVEAAVEECEKAEHPAEFDELIPCQQLSQRRYGESDQHEQQSQNSGSVKKKLDRVCSERTINRVPREQCERYDPVHENQKFGESYLVHQKYLRRSIPS